MKLCSFLKHHNIDYKIRENVSLLSFVGIGGSAALAVFPKSRCELLCLLSYLASNGIPYKVVGNMSNILPPDGIWDVCLVSTKRLRSIYFEEGSAVAECGVPISLLCRSMLACGLMPPAELFGIPATVGGAVYQNAGAFGAEISDFLNYADVYDPRQDRVLRLDRSQMHFSYRASDLSARGILLSASFKEGQGDVQNAESLLSKFSHKRRETQPSAPSLGSVFLRVGDVSAAYYIDCAGLKGYKVGGACVSRKHAGFIINEGNATAVDFRTLVVNIKDIVEERFGVSLKTEIEIIEEKEGTSWLHFV